MPKFVKKPVIVEAYQVTREMIAAHLFDEAPLPAGLSLSRADWHSGRREIYMAKLYVVTIHGQKTDVVEGDWIITEPDGVHHYPCKPDFFAATYDPVP